MGKGTVSRKQRANGITWIYRFQTTRPLDGKQVENTKVIGMVKEIGRSETDAWREVGRLGLDIHLNQSHGQKQTFGELAKHFRENELKKQSRASESKLRRLLPPLNYCSIVGYCLAGERRRRRKSSLWNLKRGSNP